MARDIVTARNILPKVIHHLLSDRGRIMMQNAWIIHADIWWVIVT